jgi:hypothetical protein
MTGFVSYATFADFGWLDRMNALSPAIAKD